MAASSAGQPGNDRTFDNFFLLIGAILIVWVSFWMLWRSHSDVILTGLFLVVGWLSKAAQHAPWLYPDSIGSSFENWANTLHKADPSDYGWPAAKLLIQSISHTLALLLIPYILLQVLKFRRIHVVNKFVRRFDLDKLKARNAEKYAAVASIRHENLLSQPLYEGSWAMARQPIDFGLLNHLIVVRKKRVGSQIMEMVGIQSDAMDSEKPIKGWTEKKIRWSVPERRRVLPHPASCRLDVVKTDARLREQLGGKFNEANLDKFEKCVLAILYTGHSANMEKARDLALKLAWSFKRLDDKGRERPTINDKGIDDVIKKHRDHHTIRAIKKRHHYKGTVLMGLLEGLWDKGIFTSAEFLWFKPVHRETYAALDFLGGDRPPSEALGLWAHYMLEKRVKHAIPEGCVEAGTDALQQMLFDEMWIGSDDGTVDEVTEKAVLGGGDDAKYSPTKGIDLYDPARRS